jgi:hypothetical protein
MCKRANYRLNEDGETEKQCTICDEWWYADDEFFETKRGGLTTHCKACGVEMRIRAALLPCNVVDCPEPRYGRASAYCRNHHYEIILRKTPPNRTNARFVRNIDLPFRTRV